jgi:uncharacterized membrane protein YsdA (DUF1294 family)/cold shock CspA family protein
MTPRTERVHGTLTSWDDDRGFGFITPQRGSERTFVHIKAFPPRDTRPQLGESLTFEVEHPSGGKRRAARVRVAGQRMPAAPRQRRPRTSAGAATYLPILLFALVYLGTNALWPIPLWVAGLYAVASVICFVVYAVDKSAASAQRWRVSETTLLLLGAVGGWPGAIVAQQILRHKTQKASFRSAFWGTVVINVIVFAVFATPAFHVFVEWTKGPL